MAAVVIKSLLLPDPRPHKHTCQPTSLTTGRAVLFWPHRLTPVPHPGPWLILVLWLFLVHLAESDPPRLECSSCETTRPTAPSCPAGLHRVCPPYTRTPCSGLGGGPWREAPVSSCLPSAPPRLSAPGGWDEPHPQRRPGLSLGKPWTEAWTRGGCAVSWSLHPGRAGCHGGRQGAAIRGASRRAGP